MSERELTEPQRLWVEALRSGIFKQTTHVLCRLDEKGEPVGFCCLGVACEIARVAGVPVVVDVSTYDDAPIRTFDAALGALPGNVRRWLGLASTTGTYGSTEVVSAALAGLNDAGETFERIADIIESAPKGLFVEEPS